MGKSRANRRNNSPKEVVPSSENVVAGGILSPELVAELGGGDDSTNSAGIGGPMAMNAKPTKGKKRGRAGAEKVSEETRDLAAKISKSKAKKLKQLVDKKAKDGRRAELYRKLEENRLSQNHMSLLQSSKTISQNQDTLKSRIKHAVQRAVAGIAVEDAVIVELEAHPDVIADVEESLSLPVGGALRAARRTQIGKSSSERVPAKAVVEVKSTGKDGVVKPDSKSNGRDVEKGSGVAGAATRRGSSTTTTSVSGRKRGRSPAPAASKLVSVISVSKKESSSDSSTDDESEGEEEAKTEQIDGGDGDEAVGEEGLGGALKTTDDAKMLASGGRQDQPADDDAPSCEKPETATNDVPAEAVGSSWAAKMMASLSQAASTKKGGAESASTLDGISSGKAKDLPGAGNEGDDDGSNDDGEDKGATAATSYPPPPSWLQAKAPAYRAVETPLPSAAGDDGGTSAAASNFRLPRPKRWVPVKRSVELQAARMQLPVCGMEQEIVEAIHDNDAVILCGETGSGKSTQVPQFLYEAGYAAHGLVGVTQPRRVAAVGTAERVAVELGTKCGRGGVVAYQIRYDASGVGEKTRVKFMTDGVLLREISSDLLLRKYSVVILDEAHERNLNTDVLLGMLSRSIPLRKQVAEEEQRSWKMLGKESKKEAKLRLRPLKLVIMSATLRVTDFTENSVLFPKPPPVITATSRQHPVTVHFNKRTELYDYLGETFKKVCKIHRRLPDGGILVFLTGKREILHMCDKLRREFPLPKARRQSHSNGGYGKPNREGNLDKGLGDKNDGQNETKGDGDGAGGGGDEVEPEQRQPWEAKPNTFCEKPRETNQELLLYREADDDEEDAARLADMEEDVEGGVGARDEERTGEDGDRGDDESALSSGSEAEGDDARGVEGDEAALPPVYVVPLYAMLTAEEQARVFRAPPEGHRIVVVATNVAETSITIPGIAYVVDCGRQKRKVVQRGSGISQFEVGWVSRASADQRAGRAGRTGPGHCYRLYSSAVYSQTFEAFAAPEVVTRPLEDVVLQMKAMGIFDVSQFPFPTPPDVAGLRSAISLLENLGATRTDRTGNGEITPVGKALALLPVGARYAKMLLLALQGGLLAHSTAVVAMLTEGDPFLRPDSAVKEDGGMEEDDKEEIRRKRAQWLHPNSDALARLKAAGAYDHATAGGTTTGGSAFCRENLLHAPTMERALQLRRQLLRLVDLRFGAGKDWKGCASNGNLKPPGRRQSDALRQVVLSGLLDNVARRAPAGTVKAGTKLQRDCAYLSCNEAIVEPLYIKSTSVLFSRDPGDLPEWVVYQSIVRGEREGAPANMTCVTAVEPSWLPALAEGSPLLTFSGPLASPPPSYDATRNTVMCRVMPRYGVHAWELPLYTMELASAAPASKPELVFRWFGRLLLEGRVAGCLLDLKGRKMLNDPPSLLTREMPTKKVSILLLELRQKGICSLPALVRRWREDPIYLKGAVALWVKVTCRKDFDAVWANAVRTGALALKTNARDEDKKSKGE